MSPFYTHTIRLPALDALEAYRRLRAVGPSILMESGAGNSFTVQNGRFSLIGVLPSAELIGTRQGLSVTVLEPFGQHIVEALSTHEADYITHSHPDQLTLTYQPSEFSGEERARFTHPTPARAIRSILGHYAQLTHAFLGLYGAFAYDFVRQFESLPATVESEVADFRLLAVDTVILINHLTGESQLICTQATSGEAFTKAQRVVDLLEQRAAPGEAFTSSAPITSPTEDAFRSQVTRAVELCEAGELLELVLARRLESQVSGDPLLLYDAYRTRNPSPYQFYVDFTDEVLLGTSPEVMVQVEGRRVTLRPISGSSARGHNAIDDHRLMLNLLNDEKEKSELDMLIDLGRNDLARVCKPGVHVDDYRAVEKYASVMHTVAQVSGELDEGLMGFDALVAALPAGTLTGAPKLAAIHYIDEIEQGSRGYYGGAVGYLHYSGAVNTAIIIRSAHIRNGQLAYLAGATLLVESQPERELRETQLKTEAFASVLTQFTLEPAR